VSERKARLLFFQDDSPARCRLTGQGYSVYRRAVVLNVLGLNDD